MAVENALSESEGWQPWYAVAAMREVVASHLTEEIFQMYTLLHAQRAEGERLRLPTARAAARTYLTPRARAAGFDWMQGVDSLEALRKRIRLRTEEKGAVTEASTSWHGLLLAACATLVCTRMSVPRACERKTWMDTSCSCENTMQRKSIHTKGSRRGVN